MRTTTTTTASSADASRTRPTLCVTPDKEQYDELAPRMGERGNSLHNDDKPPRGANSCGRHRALRPAHLDVRRRAPLARSAQPARADARAPRAARHGHVQCHPQGAAPRRRSARGQALPADALGGHPCLMPLRARSRRRRGRAQAARAVELAHAKAARRATDPLLGVRHRVREGGEWEAALELLERMDARTASRPAMLLNAAVAAYARRKCRRRPSRSCAIAWAPARSACRSHHLQLSHLGTQQHRPVRRSRRRRVRCSSA